MSVEDAAKIIISAGMVNPETQARLQRPRQADQECVEARTARGGAVEPAPVTP